MLERNTHSAVLCLLDGEGARWSATGVVKATTGWMVPGMSALALSSPTDSVLFHSCTGNSDTLRRFSACRAPSFVEGTGM